MNIFLSQAKAHIENTHRELSLLANLSALIYESFPNLNWAGFYLYDQDQQELYLGPFQGKVACTLIKKGAGVCGTAVATGQVQVVDDVHQFPGHIACDSASNSELVIPVFVQGKVHSVLDIDSVEFGNFKEEYVKVLTEVVKLLQTKLEQLRS